MFKKYKWNFVFVVLIVTVITFLIFDVFLFYSIRSYLFHQTFDEMRMKTSLVVEILKEKNSFPLKPESDELWKLTFQIKTIVNSRVTIIDSIGKVLYDSDVSRNQVVTMDNHLNRPEVQQALLTGWGQSYRTSDTINRKLFYTAFAIKLEGDIVGFLRLAFYAHRFEASMKQIFELIIISNLVGSVIMFFAAVYLGSIVTYPVLRIVAIAQQIAAGDFSRVFPDKRKDEIGTLANILNQLTQSLKNHINQISSERSKLENILTNLNVGIIAVDKDSNILNVNSALNKILKIAEIDLRQKNISEVIKWQPLLAAIECSLNRNCTENGEFSYFDESGKRFLSYLISPFLFSESAEMGALIQLRDITEIKQLEAIRRNFVASASHELKTPLTSIIGYTETLLEGAVPSPQASLKFIQRINEQAKRLEYLVADLLKLSQLEHDIPLDLATIRLLPFLKRIVENFKQKAAQKKIALTLEVFDPQLKIDADEELMRTVFENLIDNALKYTSADGSVKVKVTPTGKKSITLEVTDTGIGIDPKYHARIFQRFYRVDKARSRELGGTGLGLAIVRHIIERHGSKIFVSSKPGKGSCFYFRMKRL